MISHSASADIDPFRESFADPHLVGWTNTFIPGLGASLRGAPIRGLGQLGYEGGSVLGGFLLTDRQGFSSLDGVTDTFKPFKQTPSVKNAQQSVEAQQISDIMIEFGVKAHMVNTFVEYRDAYKDKGITEGLDQHSALEGFTLPFKPDYIKEPDVWIPLTIAAGAIAADYFTASKDPIEPLNGTSNMLYDFSNGFWQPMGSGYPEEAFYRGFLQHEFTHASGSSVLGIVAQSTLFAFSHEPGNGRFAAAATGAYLGWLADRHNGDLGPGTTLHFWGDFLLGLETILLSHRSQRTTPQGGFSVQFNY